MRRELIFLQALAFLTVSKTIVEVGVCNGDMAEYLCRVATINNGKYVGFDVWSIHGINNQFNYDYSKESVESRLTKCGYKCFQLVKINTNSEKLLFEKKLDSLCKDGIDFAFIDGCHSYYGIFNNFFSIYPRLTSTGIIVFHDTVTIDGCREFMLDLRTKFYDGTFDLIDLPYGNDNYCGISILSKRSLPISSLSIKEICGSISSPHEIEKRETEWFKKEVVKNKVNSIPQITKENILSNNIGIYENRKKFNR